jgi:DNA-binding NtrC family response regulator
MSLPDKIVIIDSEHFICELLGEFFGELGYRVYLAETLSEGLDAVSANNISVAIMDIGRGTGNDMEAVDRLKRIQPGIRVILISGYPTLGTALTALRHDAFDFVVKPFNLEELKGIVTRAFAFSPNRAVEKLQNRIEVLENLLSDHDITPPQESEVLAATENGT